MAPRCRMQSRECDGCGACMGMYGEEDDIYDPLQDELAQEDGDIYGYDDGLV